MTDRPADQPRVAREFVAAIEKKYGHCCGDVLNIHADDLAGELASFAATVYGAAAEAGYEQGSREAAAPRVAAVLPDTPRLTAREFWKTLPHCLGYPACDGDLVGMPHSDACPLRDKEELTIIGFAQLYGDYVAAAAPSGLPEPPPVGAQDSRQWPTVTRNQAVEAALALIDAYFGNGKRRVKICIPRETDDTDVLLMDYLKQTPGAPAEAERLAAENRQLRDVVTECLWAVESHKQFSSIADECRAALAQSEKEVPGG